MIGNDLLFPTRKTQQLAVVLASMAMFAVGCGNMTSTATDATPLTTGAAISGMVHGGNQPVGYATVQIYTVGQTGLGSAGTLLATTTTSAAGNFSFSKQAGTTVYPSTGNTYSCPTNGGVDMLLYIVSRGGNTTGAGGSSINNSSAVFIAPLGFCSTVTSSQFVNISEVTTAAMVAATAQFINPSTEMIGNDGIGVAYNAIANAFKTIPNLVSAANGLSNSSFTTSGASATGGYNVAGVSIVGVPEAAKLNTVANILSSCINQPTGSGGNCAMLFADAVPPPNVSATSQPSATFPAATDTLQAALYMFLNPTDAATTGANGTSNRTALFNLSPAAGAPYQPTISAVPSDWTIGISYSSSSSCGTGSGFFSHPRDIQVDLSGNLWIANAAGSNSSLVAITASGVPMSCQGLTGNAIADNVDINGNIWYADSANSAISRFSPATQAVKTYTTAAPPQDVITDGSGNVFFTTLSGGTGSVYLIRNGANTDGVSTPVLISNTVGPNPAHLFPDAAGDVWVTSGSSYVTEVSAATGGTLINGFASTQYTVPSPSYGIIVGPQNRIFVTSQNPSASMTVLAPTGTTSYGVATGFPTATNAGGLSNPAGIWLDGGLNSWIANNGIESSTGYYGLSEITVTGTAISASGAGGGLQKTGGYLNAGRAILVDAAGNVWTSNDNNGTSITEVVGAAVPIYGPFSSGLQNGRFQAIP